MNEWAHISERSDAQARHEESIAFAAHKLARYAHDKYLADEFARLAWCWVYAGRDAGDEHDQLAIRDAAIADVLSNASRVTRRLWQGFMDLRRRPESINDILAWRDLRLKAAA